MATPPNGHRDGSTNGGTNTHIINNFSTHAYGNSNINSRPNGYTSGYTNDTANGNNAGPADGRPNPYLRNFAARTTKSAKEVIDETYNSFIGPATETARLHREAQEAVKAATLQRQKAALDAVTAAAADAAKENNVLKEEIKQNKAAALKIAAEREKAVRQAAVAQEEVAKQEQAAAMLLAEKEAAEEEAGTLRKMISAHQDAAARKGVADKEATARKETATQRASFSPISPNRDTRERFEGLAIGSLIPSKRVREPSETSSTVSPVTIGSPASIASPQEPAATAVTPGALSSLGRIPKRARAHASLTTNTTGSTSVSASSATTANTALTTAPREITSSRYPMPLWYNSLGPVKQGYRPKQGERGVWDRLNEISTIIKVCSHDRNNQILLQQHFKKLRGKLHAIEFLDGVNQTAVRRTFLLHEDRGLPQIFDPELSGVTYPWDIRLDAEMLYNKWVAEVFDTDLLRGIKTTAKFGEDGKKDRFSDSIDGTKADWHEFGNGSLVSGQWWPSQLCTVRDGAHGSSQGGIAGIEGKGATSIIMAGGQGYQHMDKDEGETVWYCGTKSKDSEPTSSTQRMIESIASKNPVRVIRSMNLPVDNRYRPKVGYRYDGLYEVIDSKCVEKSTAQYLFHLRRQAGQHPIRASGVEERPTEQQIREYNVIKSKG